MSSAFASPLHPAAADALAPRASLVRALADCIRARARTSLDAVHVALNLTWCVSILQLDWTPATSPTCCKVGGLRHGTVACRRRALHRAAVCLAVAPRLLVPRW